MQSNHLDSRAESLDKTTIKVNPNRSTLTRDSGQNYCQKGPKMFRLSPGVLEKPSSKKIPNCSDSQLRVWTKSPSKVNLNRSDSHPRVWTKSLSNGTKNDQTLTEGLDKPSSKRNPTFRLSAESLKNDHQKGITISLVILSCQANL